MSEKVTKQERRLYEQKRKDLIQASKRAVSSADLKIKVILLGNSFVGKTSLMRKFLDQTVDIRKTETTVGCDFQHRELPLMGKSVDIRIWDTFGMERYHEASLLDAYYRNTDGVLLTYSVDDRSSFDALPRWLQRFRDKVGSDRQFDCCVVGNKADLTVRRQVSWQEAQNFAHQLGFPYIETSALDVVNVHKAFTDLALVVIKRYEIVRQFDSSQTNGKSFKLGNGNRSNSSESSGRFCSGCN